MIQKHLSWVIVAVVCVTGAIAYAAKDDTKSIPADGDLFKGKIVCVGTRVSEQCGWIENARMKRIGNRLYIGGECAKPSDFPNYPEMVQWMAMDEVTMLVEYNSIEDATKAYRMRLEREKNKP